MHSRASRRQVVRLAGAVFASLPLPALAADPSLSAWGAYLFFAVVASVVIVLLLHEALGDEPTDDQRAGDGERDRRNARSTSALRYNGADGRDDNTRRAA